MSLRLRSRSRDARRRGRSDSRAKRKAKGRRKQSSSSSASKSRSPPKKKSGGGGGFDMKVMPEDLERVQALARQYNHNKSVAQAVALHVEQNKNIQPLNPEVEAFLAQYPQIQAHAAARLRALPKDAQTNVLMRGGLGSARDPTAMLLGRIRSVDPFNATWVPHTPGMQPFPSQSQLAQQQQMVASMVPSSNKPPPPPVVEKPKAPQPQPQPQQKDPSDEQMDYALTAIAEGELLNSAGSNKKAIAGKAAAAASEGPIKRPAPSDWRRSRPMQGEEVAAAKAEALPPPISAPPLQLGFGRGEFSAAAKPAPPPPAPPKLGAPGMPPAAPLGGLVLPPGIGVAKTKAAAPPPVVPGLPGIQVPAPAGSAVPRPAEPGPEPPKAKAIAISPELESRKNDVQSSLANLAASLLGKEVAAAIAPKPEEAPKPPAAPPAPPPSVPPRGPDLNNAARLAEQAVFGAANGASSSTAPAPVAGGPVPGTASLGGNAAVTKAPGVGQAPPPPPLGGAASSSALPYGVPAPPGPPPGAPLVPPPGAPNLDAPLTEAQIASLPPAVQEVLRRKHAAAGLPPPALPPPGAPAAFPGGVPGLPPHLQPPPAEPVAPAAEELTPEQQKVLQQLRQQQEERERKEAAEKEQKQAAEQQAQAAETAYQNFWVQRQMASLMSLYQQGHAIQQERKISSAQDNYWEGDWKCAKCGDHQFARNRECRNCGHVRTT
eukprot:TRINITY_DN29666_c0_g1_i1.p1 TRINITY_DN29666_c0_g1~~TRINITY_DN29666_c0_g1_i1.p1  ORF type:complete len:716 (-),score=184.64 TRINITY_DN29666_c0_g1_i1:52-2199(-)